MDILNLGFDGESEKENAENPSVTTVEDAELRALQFAAGQPDTLDVTAVMTEGAEAVPAPGVEPGFPVDSAPKRRGRPKGSKNANAAPSGLEIFFSPAGIGQLWVNGWNAFYRVCEAPQLTPEEEAIHKDAFVQVARKWFPPTASAYQAELLLAFCVLSSTLPRMNPVAKATAPLFVRVWNWALAPFRRKKAE